MEEDGRVGGSVRICQHVVNTCIHTSAELAAQLWAGKHEQWEQESNQVLSSSGMSLTGL